MTKAQNTAKDKLSRTRIKKIAKAQKDFRKLVQEIAPFIKPRKVERLSTARRWQVAGSPMGTPQASHLPPHSNKVRRKSE